MIRLIRMFWLVVWLLHAVGVILGWPLVRLVNYDQSETPLLRDWLAESLNSW